MTAAQVGIDGAKIAGWVARFNRYRHSPDADALTRWISRFANDDRALAGKILDHVVLIPEIDILTGYREALDELPGWSRDIAQRNGRWFFAGYGGFGESGQTMLHKFREANDMTSKSWKNFFVTARDLPSLRLTSADTVVFVDDFSGTGRQICTEWPETEELIASDANCHLLLIAATTDAITAIRKSTSLNLNVRRPIEPVESVFNQANAAFSEEDRRLIKKYGKKAWSRYPKGYGDCGLLYVLSHKTPNNTIPILHANHDEWEGPFPRSLLKAMYD